MSCTFSSWLSDPLDLRRPCGVCNAWPRAWRPRSPLRSVSSEPWEKPWKTGRCFPMVCHGNPIKNHGTTSNHGKNPVVFPWMIFRNETLWLNNKKRGFLVVSCGYSCSYHLKTTDIQSMLIQLIYSGIYQLMYINYKLYCNDLV